MALPLKSPKAERLYTADEFMALSLDPDKRHELVRGIIRERPFSGEEHGLVSGNLNFALGNYVRAKRLGRMLPPVSFELQIDPESDTVRIPDLAFLSKEKLTGQRGAIKVPPDLAVEVYSTNDRPADYVEKFEDYRVAGWNLVWLIYPPNSSPKRKAGKVEIYRLQESLKPVKTLSGPDLLDGEEIIPGFSIEVNTLFDYGV